MPVLDGGEREVIAIFRRVGVGSVVLAYRRHDLLEGDSRGCLPVRGLRQCALAVPAGDDAVGYARCRLQRLDFEHISWLRALDEHWTGDHMGSVLVEIAW